MSKLSLHKKVAPLIFVMNARARTPLMPQQQKCNNLCYVHAIFVMCTQFMCMQLMCMQFMCMQFMCMQFMCMQLMCMQFMCMQLMCMQSLLCAHKKNIIISSENVALYIIYIMQHMFILCIRIYIYHCVNIYRYCDHGWWEWERIIFSQGTSKIMTYNFFFFTELFHELSVDFLQLLFFRNRWRCSTKSCLICYREEVKSRANHIYSFMF